MAKLEGKTILVTRTAEDNPAWSEAIRALGGEPIEFPCLRCEIIRDTETAERLAKALHDAHWLALSSRRGAEAVAELYDGGLPDQLRVAAVGETTAREARTRLGRCDLVAPDGTGAGLAGELLAAIRRNGTADSARVVAAAAREGTTHLEEILSPAGIAVTRVAVYRTIPAPLADRKRDLAGFALHAVLLASPSAVRGLTNQALVPPGVKLVTIGPATTKAVKALGLEVAAEARRPALDALLEAIP